MTELSDRGRRGCNWSYAAAPTLAGANSQQYNAITDFIETTIETAPPCHGHQSNLQSCEMCGNPLELHLSFAEAST